MSDNTIEGDNEISSERPTLEAIEPMLKQRFNAIPFNKTCGLELTKVKEDEIEVQLKLTDALVGNEEHRMLHGGVICTIIDAVGGAMSMAGAFTRMNNEEADDSEYLRLGNIGTVNLHVDFLRPGRGELFTCKGKLLRAGGKVIAVNMELRNEKDVLIAVGGGSFLH